MAPPIEGIEPFLFAVILDARFFPVGLRFAKDKAEGELPSGFALLKTKPKVSCRWASSGGQAGQA